MDKSVKIRCIYCGCPCKHIYEEKIIAWICADCLKKIKQESELRKASTELS